MRSNLLRILISLLITGLALFLEFTPNITIRSFTGRLELMTYDLKLRLSHWSNTFPIVVIDVDEKSLQEQGRWPWPRNKLAELLSKLQQQDAAVIALDMFF